MPENLAQEEEEEVDLEEVSEEEASKLVDEPVPSEEGE